MTRSPDSTTLALIDVAAAIASGQEAALASALERAIHVEVPAEWLEELVLQSVLMVGWPRALNAAAAWRAASGHPAPPDDPDLDYGRAATWEARGEETCRMVYGDNYEKLRANVRALHPALDRWMLMEGYGRTLARPSLALPLRELCTVAQCAVLEVPRQLHSHLRGALHAGASREEVDAALAAAAAHTSDDVAGRARLLWQGVRP